MSENEPAVDENRLIAERRAKLAQLRERGIAFPNDFRRQHLAGDLHAAHGGKADEELVALQIKVVVAGRMMAKRVMGKASFATIADPSGRIQLFLQSVALGEAYDAFKGWDVGDTLGAEGELFRTRTGELSVKVTALRLLVKSLRPLPDKWHGLADTDTRYRQRYVDLIVNEEARKVFVSRTRLVRKLREVLDSLEFMEVETPMMQPIPGGAAARPFITHHNALDMQMYLRIAPELYLKRLVVGGFERVYEINRNFRNEGLSTRHNPEFTMLELYWAYADYHDLMTLVESLCTSLADVIPGTRQPVYQGRAYNLEPPYRRVSMADVIVEHNPGIDASKLRDVAYLRAWCERIGARTDAADGAGKLQVAIFDQTVEHTLLDPTFIYAYPAEVSPLSRANDADPFITDRFEFFVAGRELANGFSELNDPEDQAERFRAQVDRKDAGDEEAMFYDADYIRALEYGMPPTAGLGIGVDRLVMFLTDQAAIRDVLLFPQVRPGKDLKANPLDRDLPIGVFDSGVGGLTVLAALRARLPAESFLYLGDTARLPYGTKTAGTVERYALQAVASLVQRGVKAVVVACNTASAAALPVLASRHDLPLIGVVEPGADAAARTSRNGRIAVLATESTVRGGAYQRAIAARRPDARVTAVAAGLFVALAEEGWVEGPIAESIAARYLAPLFGSSEAPDTLVLGCTHFPPLLGAIRAVAGEALQIVDSAATTAHALAALISSHGLQASGGAGAGETRFLVTDGIERFLRTGPGFLGTAIAPDQVERVDLQEMSA